MNARKIITRIPVKEPIFVVLMVVTLVCLAMAQAVTPGSTTSSGAPGAATPTVDVLGAHNNYGRGCSGCHAPHSGARGSGGNAITGGPTDPYSGSSALFAQDMGPLYGQTFDFSNLSNGASLGGTVVGASSNTFIFVAPSSLVGASTQGYNDIRGILMCLACHDGAIAKGAMMTNEAYEQRIGALPSSYGTAIIPTLFATATAGAYHADHPVGENATLAAVMGTYYGTGSATNGLNFTFSGTAPSQRIATITPVGEYAQFMSSYGAPAIMYGRLSGGWNYWLPVNASGTPYILCTTCHNQHVMNIYAASPNTPVAGTTAGTYATYFFVRGPFNINNVTVPSTSSASTTQFCRQCHFDLSNEANGSTLPTAF
jgi:hypothetical protein